MEVDGKWTRGMCVVDRRGRPKGKGPQNGDLHGWLDTSMSNQVWRISETPGVEAFPKWIVKAVFGETGPSEKA